mgnify:CR=1 FL=1
MPMYFYIMGGFKEVGLWLPRSASMRDLRSREATKLTCTHCLSVGIALTRRSMAMPRITTEESRRRMAEILREQSQRPTLRPRPDEDEARNPFRRPTAEAVPMWPRPQSERTAAA